jgi:hypothetical protein
MEQRNESLKGWTRQGLLDDYDTCEKCGEKRNYCECDKKSDEE